MIQVGQKKETKYWGNFSVSKVARLNKPVECQSKEAGVALFDPTIVKIQRETPPSEDKQEYWFPYGITIGGKEECGQFAPVIGEQALLELLKDAIGQELFNANFLMELKEAIDRKLWEQLNFFS